MTIKMPTDSEQLLHATQQALANAQRHLLAARTPEGHWEGHLSSSALSTATAIFALHLADAERHKILIASGIVWLLENQNPDGGWGDTTLSFSNISTTALCYAALSIAGDEAKFAVAAARIWLTRAAGSVEPANLARAIADRYGKDRTFSVPILTMCALAGRLGNAREAWRLITQLPFELAAFPQSWFRFFRLPVVSYALPALIAMGLARHRNRPTRNPLTRLIRSFITKRVLKVLATIQPTGGGFLEATPLTSFVAMSLIGAGQHDTGVVANCIDFLVRSARPDGSWPIDTNLATWITTLSVNALPPDALDADQRRAIRQWLLNQQYHQRHPYTGAPPGAWAWTDLPGGVPDADDTAGALLALHNLGDIDEPTTSAASAAIRWLIDLQNSDGGIPTFCRGWTNLPFDRSGADLTAHALHAWAVWQGRMPADIQAGLSKAIDRALRYLEKVQSASGAWVPLWFGNQHAREEANPVYGTAKVLIALAAFKTPLASVMKDRAIRYLSNAQNEDGGWGGAPDTPSSIEETALALTALALTTSDSPQLQTGVNWLIQATRGGQHFPPAPIGFYFAKLWYYEREYPVLLTLQALALIAGRQAGAPR